MILLDIVTPGIRIGLGNGDQALVAIVFFIVVVCAIPFIIERRQ